MEIIKAKYINSENDGVLITFDDDSTFIIPTFSNRYKFTDMFNEWLDDSGLVEVYQTQAELDEKTKNNRIAEIDIRLKEIDILSIRSLRSKSNGRGNSQDDTKLTELDDEAIALRDERIILTA